MDNNLDLFEDTELQMLKNNKLSAYNYRQRRQEDWTENYTLYRDKVQLNRLTQRQSVNVPLMKTQLRTLLKDVDDMPVMYFENLDNNKEAEVFQNEYWKDTLICNKMELKDIIDKKQAFFFGRTFDQMQIIDGKIVITIEDPEDILVDRYMDPTDIDTAHFLIHTHIFRPLSNLEDDPLYDKKAVATLKTWYGTEMGLITASDNADSLAKRNEKMGDLGVSDINSPVLGETYVELTLHFIKRKEKDDRSERIYLYVEADDQQILMKKPLDEIIGKTKDDFWQTHFPYNSWADDVDKQDVWTDGIADMLRNPNKILNAWWSQMVENRTLKNLNMMLYDTTKTENFDPQSWQPQAFGKYGVPGKPTDVIQQLPVQDLTGTLDEINFLVAMSEKASGATANLQGAENTKQITLGEVQIALSEAKERVKGMSKFYTHAYEERALKFLKLIEAAPEKLDAVKIYKQGRNSTDIYAREIAPKDFMTESGYRVKIWSQDEKDSQNTAQLEKLNAVKTMIPGNPKLIEIVNRKALEFADLSPDDINSIMEIEKEKMDAMLNPQPMVDPGMPAGQDTGQPGILPNQPPFNAPAPVEQPVAQPSKKKSSSNGVVVDKLKSLRSQIAAG
jgi:hypothetical protein